MFHRLVSVIGVLFFTISSVFAQEYNIKTYTVNDGLPSSYVYDVLIDDLGIVWFATANGLVKYDGKNFRKYDSENGLKDELIYDIYKDFDGDLWVSTEFGGVAKFVDDSLIYLPELSAIDTILVNFISNGPNGKVWFSTSNHGIYEWEKGKNVTQKLTTENGLPNNQVWDFIQDEEGKIWISTSDGIAVYEDGGISATYTQKNGLSGGLAYQVFIAENGDKWVPTSNGVSIIHSDSIIKTITEVDGEELGYVFSITQGDDGKIWIGTESNGLFILDGEDKRHITKRNGLSSNDVYRLIKDEEGTIWVATDGDGVSVIGDNNFLIYDSSSELDANSIYSTLEASDGVLWIGTENGISSFENEKFTNYKLPLKYFDEGEIWDIEELPNGNLILLAGDYDIIEFDGSRFFHPIFFDDLFEYFVSDILVDENGTIWFTAFQALLKYEDGRLTKYDPPEDKYWQTDLTAILKDSRGYFWISTEGGLANFDGKNFTYIAEKEGLKGGSIYNLEEDEYGNLWVGTNKGIFVLKEFDENGIPAKITPFETLDLYMKETIFFQFDSSGNLWQATNGGLNHFNLANLKDGEMARQQHFPFNSFGHGIEFNGSASVSTKDGTLWFGSDSRGLIRLDDPNSVVDTSHQKPPKVFLRKVLANDILFYDQLAENNSSIDLDFDQNNISFKFNGIDFTNPNRIAYKYMLEGFDREWQYGTDIDEVRYTNVPSGEYEFLISAKSLKSPWGDVKSLAVISIAKPYWEQVWFFIILGIGFIFIAFSFVKILVARTEKLKLKSLVNEQTKDIQVALDEKEVLIKEIHHRVKNNLAVISGLLELQSWNLPEGEAKEALQESKLRVLAMSKIHENLYQNKDLAKVDFKKFLRDLIDGILITMKSPTQDIYIALEVDNVFLGVNTGIPIGLMINELVSNCFKHAFDSNEKGEISVQFREMEEEYYLVIKDNGKGSSENVLNVSNTTSLGMTLVQSLAGQISASLKYSGKKGSVFEVKIPKKKPSGS